MKHFAGSLDANIILRFMLRDIIDQYELVAKLLRSTQKQFAVADTALIEVAFVLAREYKMERQHIARAIEAFMLMPQINCNRALFDAALDYYERSPALTLEDCCLAVYATLSDATPLYTFDKKLARQASSTKLLA